MRQVPLVFVLGTSLVLVEQNKANLGCVRLQSALWPSSLQWVAFGLKCVQMAVNDSQIGLSQPQLTAKTATKPTFCLIKLTEGRSVKQKCQ